MKYPEIITQKSYELFLKYGVKSVTMDDIAAELGIAKKTIYKFFASKDALVESFVEKAIKENENSCKKCVDESFDPIIELFFTMVCAQRLYNDLNYSILHELEKKHRNAYLAVKQHKEMFIFQAIKTSIEKGVKKQLYQDDFNQAIMARFFLESLNLISNNSIFSATTYHTADLSEEIFGHLISGIATSAGTDLINRYKDQRRFTKGTPQWRTVHLM